jgi:AraC-like DNA-binding protein
MASISASPLSRHRVLRSADIDEGANWYSRVLTPCDVSARGRLDGDVLVDVALARLGPVTIVHGHHRGAELAVELRSPVDYYDAHFCLDGTGSFVRGPDTVRIDACTAAILSPGMMATMTLPREYRQLHVSVDRAALEQHLERLIARPVTRRIEFRQQMDLRSERVSSWRRSIRLLTRELDSSAGLLASDHMVRPWCEMIMTGLLLAQPNSYSDQLAGRDDSTDRPGPLLRALRLIEADPSANLGLEQLALQAGCSCRSLQRYFAQHVGMAPRDYVERIKLAGVHEDLRRESPATATVTSIAHRWGFEHVSRFAGVYRRRYGQSPSETLRQSP